MQFVKLRDTYGINLDHVLEWTDYPTIPEPFRDVLTTVASENEYAQRVPHRIRISGEDRLKMLHWLDAVMEKEDWKAAYEETRDELYVVRNRLAIFDERAYLGDSRAIWEIILNHENREAARAAQE